MYNRKFVVEQRSSDWCNMYSVWPDDESKGCRKSMRERAYIDPLGSLPSWEDVSGLAQFRSSKGSRNKLLLIMKVPQIERANGIFAGSQWLMQSK